MATGTTNTGSIDFEEGAASAPSLITHNRLYKAVGSDKLILRTTLTQYDMLSTADSATAAQGESLTTGKVITADTLAGMNSFRTKYGGRVACEYDFTVHASGGVATYNLIRVDATANTEVAYIPDKSRITNGYLYVKTAAVSGGAATIAFGVATDHAAGLLAATAYGGFTAGAWMQLIPDRQIANFTTATTAQRNIIMAIAGASLTAGRFILYLDYVTTP